MKNRLIVLGLGLLGLLSYNPNLVEAQGTSIQNRFFTSYDTESITVAGTAIGFTATKVTPVGFNYRASRVNFVIECSSTTPCPIRILTTGGTPTSAVGLLSNQGDIVTVFGYDDINNFKAIRTTANSAVIQPVYSR